MSRDATVRRVLRGHLEKQVAASPDARLSHITTVLRFPPKPPGKHSTDGRRYLQIRIEDDLQQLADETQLLLPGQAPKRSHRDYVTRPLTDAVTTAVYRYNPFVVDELVEVPQVLAHCEAVGLWRFVLSATFTPPETQAMGRYPHEASRSPEEEAALADLRAGDHAWHHPLRTVMAVHFARELFAGDHAPSYRSMLRAQGAAFEAERTKLEDGTHWLFGDAPNLAFGSTYGRGGASLWRRARAAAVDELSTWYVNPNRTASHTVDIPGWNVRVPAGWTHVVLDGPLTPAQAEDVDARRVLRLDHNGATALIGYKDLGKPVPGLAAALNAWIGLASKDVAELLGLVDFNLQGVHLLAPQAHELGFISAEHRDNLIHRATIETDRRILQQLTTHADLYDADKLAELRRLADQPDAFEHAAQVFGSHFSIRRPWWRWDIEYFHPTLADEAGDPARIAALATAFARFRRRELDGSMESTSKRALHGYTRPLRPDYDDESTGDAPWTLEDLLGNDKSDDV